MKRGGAPAEALADAIEHLESAGWVELPTPRPLRVAIDDLRGVAERFFARTEQGKLAFDIRASSGHRGYVPISEQGGYADEGERRYEAFDIGREPQARDTMHHPLRGRNRYPDPTFGDAATAAYRAYERFAEVLGRQICSHLGVEPHEFQRLRTEPINQLRLIRYHDPEVIDLRPEGSSAMGAHTDYEFFTIFHQNHPGLEVLDRSGEWIEADWGLDTITVMTGDLLEVFSGGRFLSVLHRAGARVRGGRLSIPFFCGADFTARVRPVAGGSYEEIAFGDHLMRQLRRDFPYLRPTLVNDPRRGETELIDLTDSTPFERLSAFEHRRLGTLSDDHEQRRR